MDVLLGLICIILVAGLIANTVYGLVLWARTQEPGPRRTANIVGALFLYLMLFPFVAAAMLGYVPWRLHRNSQLAA